MKKPTQKEINNLTLRASGSKVWSNCNAVPYFKINGDPFADDSAAVFGNAVHKNCFNQLTGKTERFTEFERLCINERKDDFIDHSFYYLDSIESYKFKEDENKPGEIMIIYLIEEKLEYKTKAGYTISGTMDYACIRIDIKRKHFHMKIFDLKTGYLPVEIVDNTQIFVYAHLIYDALSKLLKKNKIDISTYTIEVDTAIIQPAFNEMVWGNVDIDFEVFENLFNTGKPEFISGIWCKYCEIAVAGRCKELKKKIKLYLDPQFMDADFSRIKNIEKILPDMEILNKISERLLKDAKQLLKDGHKIKGYGIEQKPKHEIWLNSIEPDEIIKKTGLNRKKVIKESIKTPAEVKKLGGKITGLTYRVMNNYLVEKKKEREDSF